jgi:hypothetical protein
VDRSLTDLRAVSDPALWKKWVAKLEDKGFFNGAPAGSDEYNTRIKKALAKYKERVADAKPTAVRTDLHCVAALLWLEDSPCI